MDKTAEDHSSFPNSEPSNPYAEYEGFKLYGNFIESRQDSAASAYRVRAYTNLQEDDAFL